MITVGCSLFLQFNGQSIEKKESLVSRHILLVTYAAMCFIDSFEFLAFYCCWIFNDGAI